MFSGKQTFFIKLGLAIIFGVFVAILVPGPLTVTLAGLVVLVIGAFAAARLLVDYVYPLTERGAAFGVRWARTQDNPLASMLRHLPHQMPPELAFFILLIAGVVGGLAAFLAILEDVVTGDPLVVVDQVVYQLLQQLRSYWGDYGLVAITELGDAQVVIPVGAAAVVVFFVAGNWRAAKYLLVAFLGASAWVELLKLVLHRSRPVDLYTGASSFSFPSGHATISIALYGFLALVLAHEASPRPRRGVINCTVSLVLLIAVSRLYLGAHWLSDVLAGLSFGFAWVAILAIAYFQKAPTSMPNGRLCALLFAIFVVSGVIHVAGAHSTDMTRYALARGTTNGPPSLSTPYDFWKRGHR